MNDSPVLPTRGQALPEISGTSPDGSIIRVSDFRGRRNVVVIFSDQESDSPIQKLIQTVANRNDEIRNENAEIVIVAAGPTGSVPFRAISDDRYKLHRTIGAVDSVGNALAAVCIADRYGEVYAAEFCSDTRCLSADDILDWLEFIEIQCPECGVAEWPWTGS